MRDILITLIVFSTIPFILKRPYIGLLVMAWLGYMNPHRASWGFAYNFPFTTLIASATILALLLTRDFKKIPWHYGIVWVWVAWFIWMNITTIFALEPDHAIPEWSRAIKIQVLTFLAIMLLQSRERVHLLVWVIVVSVGFFGVKGGVFTVLTGGKYMVFGPPGTFFSGNNALAIALLMVIPLMRFLQIQADSKVIKNFLLLGMLLCGISVLASYSRGAFLAAAAVAFYFLLKSNKKILIAPILLVIGIATLSFMPDKYFERLETIQTYEQDRSAMGRINSWYFALNVAKDRPLVGGGFLVFHPDQFSRYAPDPTDFHDAHSIYFEVLGEHGFVGLALFLLLGALALRTCSSIIKFTKDVDDLKWAFHLASMTYVAFIGYAVGGLFLGLAYFDLYYHLVAIVVLTRIEVDRYLSGKDIPLVENQRSGNR